MATPYEMLRWANKPAQVRFILIAESPPDPGNGPIRFFYAPEFRPPESLYRGVAEALLGRECDFRDKPTCLARIRARGWWLLDATNVPVNRITKAKRRAAVREGFDHLRVTLLDPCVRPSIGVVICVVSVFRELAAPVRSLGLTILHEDPIPFPGRFHRKEFIHAVRRIAKDHGG